MEGTLPVLISTAQKSVLWVAVLVFLILVFSYVPRWRIILRYRNLPPGPLCWPLIGYRPFIYFEDTQLHFKELTKKYGPIFSIFAGTRLVVVLEDFEHIKDAFKREEFLGRPEGALRINPDVTNIGCMNGDVWKDHRRFQMNSLRFSGVGTKVFEELVMGQVEIVRSLLEAKRSDIEVNKVIELPINNAIFGVVFGRCFDHDHPLIRFLSVYERTMLPHILIQTILVYFPWARSYFKYIHPSKNVKDCSAKMDKIIEHEIQNHRRTLNRDEPRDYIDRFLIRMDSGSEVSSYTQDILCENIKALLQAGSGTTKLTVTWLLMCTAAFPKVQDNIQEEIDNVLGREKEPIYSDRALLPYTEAVILEVMRWKNLLHLNLMREVLEDTTLMGYDIPKGTIIVQNMTSLFRNHSHLGARPDEFDPNRFLSEDRRTLHVPEQFIPFGYGKRSCPGEKLASTTVFLFSVSLLQRFRILPPVGGVKLDSVSIFTNQPVHPFVRFQIRE